MTPHVVFICVANRLRSVFAEFFFAETFSKNGDDISVSSAGFVPQTLKDQLAEANIRFPQPFYNRPMSELTRTALLERGIGVPEGWRSRGLSPKMIEEADLMVTALPAQKEDICTLYREARSKIFTIRDLSEREDYLFFEDFSKVPLDDSYWHYVEEDPEYVSKTLKVWEETLIGALPNIIKKLGIRDR